MFSTLSGAGLVKRLLQRLNYLAISVQYVCLNLCKEYSNMAILNTSIALNKELKI